LGTRYLCRHVDSIFGRRKPKTKRTTKKINEFIRKK